MATNHMAASENGLYRYTPSNGTMRMQSHLCSNKAIWLRLKIGYTMIHRYTYTGYSNHDYPDQHGHYSIFRHNKASYVDDSLQTITVTSSECRQTHPFYQWIASRSNACILKGRLSRGSTLKPIAWLLQTRNLDMSSQKMQRVVDAMWFYMFGNTTIYIYISWYYIVCLYVLLWYGKTYCKEKCDMQWMKWHYLVCSNTV